MSDDGLQRREWDSTFLGYEIGALRVGERGGLDLDGHLARARQAGFALVYIMVPSANTQAIQTLSASPAVKLVDRKLTYGRATAGVNADSLPSPSASIVSYHDGLGEELIDLALQSGVYSRFKTDPGFRNHEFEKIYTEWIRKSVSREIADELFVYEDEGHPRGLITLKRDGDVAEIGLVATQASCRGQGIGTQLIGAALAQARQWHCPQLQVPTQRANTPACAFYERNGFAVRDEVYVYHWWRR